MGYKFNSRKEKCIVKNGHESTVCVNHSLRPGSSYRIPVFYRSLRLAKSIYINIDMGLFIEILN